MTNYAILRVQKLKKTDLHLHSAHVMRTQETFNADPELTKYNQILVGSGTPQSSVEDYIKKHSLKVRNSTTVHAVEMLLTASPQYFRAIGKKFDTAKTKAFADVCKKFLQDKYGDRVVFSVLHLDETTPHIHATIVPEVGGKLNAKALFDRKELIKLQDEFAAACSVLKLERGMRSSKAKHTTIKQYYKIVNDATVQMKLNYKPIKKPGLGDLWGTDYIDEANMNMRKALSYATKKHDEAAVLRSRNEAIDKQNEALRKQRDNANDKVNKLEMDLRQSKGKFFALQQDSLWNQKLLEEVMKEQPELINEIMKKRQLQIERDYHKQLEQLKKAQQSDDVNSTWISDSGFKV